MIIGIPKEIKANEKRVGMTPAGVEALRKAGHIVYVQTTAGEESGFLDNDYLAVGAQLLPTAADVYQKAKMIIKVKEPLPTEYDFFQDGQILFTYLHLAPEPELTKALLAKNIVGIAYETVEKTDHSLPLLAPMSEIAGRMSVQVGAQFLENHRGGKGILLSGVPGVLPGKVVILGGGVVGTNAAKMAVGLGADVTLLDINLARLNYLDDIFQGRIKTLVSNSYNVKEAVKQADLLIGCVLIPGAKAPQLVTEEMIQTMQPGSVVIDVAIDQGGCIATCDHATTHDEPIYIKHGVIHYSVANMPGAVARTATLALTNATLPYILALANQGYMAALQKDPALMKGLNVYHGQVTCPAVAQALGYQVSLLNNEQ